MKNIKVLFDIGHPAHFHLFKNFINYLKDKNIAFFITTRNKEITNQLIDHEGLDYKSISNPGKNLIGMLFELLKRDFRVFKIHRKEKFTHAFGTSVSIAHLTKLSKVISYNFCEDDDDIIPFQTKLIYPFTSKIIVPDCLEYGKWKSKRILVPSYHELAYLHPEVFRPDIKIIKNYGLEPKKYIILRLSALKAHHDLIARGISEKIIKKIKEVLKDYAVIESHELKKQLKIKIWDMHHVLSFSKMIISDSQTMTIESAVLGIPAVRINTFIGKSTVIGELEEKYKLAYGIHPENEKEIIKTIEYLSTDKSVDKVWEDRKNRLLKDKINFNQWMIDFFDKEVSI